MRSWLPVACHARALPIRGCSQLGRKFATPARSLDSMGFWQMTGGRDREPPACAPSPRGHTLAGQARH